MVRRTETERQTSGLIQIKGCPSWVNRVVLTARRSLPVHPAERTSSEPVDMSEKCHNPTHAVQQTAPSLDPSSIQDHSLPLPSSVSAERMAWTAIAAMRAVAKSPKKA